MGRQKNSLPPSKSLCGSACQKTGLDSFVKGKESRQAADPSFCLHDEKKWSHLAKAATVNAAL